MNKQIYDLIKKKAHDLYLTSPRLNPVDADGCPVYTEFDVCKLQVIGDYIKWALLQLNGRPKDFLFTAESGEPLKIVNELRTYEDITRYDIEASEKAFAKYEAEHEEWKKKWGIEE